MAGQTSRRKKKKKPNRNGYTSSSLPPTLNPSEKTGSWDEDSKLGSFVYFRDKSSFVAPLILFDILIPFSANTHFLHLAAAYIL